MLISRIWDKRPPTKQEGYLWRSLCSCANPSPFFRSINRFPRFQRQSKRERGLVRLTRCLYRGMYNNRLRLGIGTYLYLQEGISGSHPVVTGTQHTRAEGRQQDGSRKRKVDIEKMKELKRERMRKRRRSKEEESLESHISTRSTILLGRGPCSGLDAPGTWSS